MGFNGFGLENKSKMHLHALRKKGFEVTFFKRGHRAEKRGLSPI